MQDQIITPNQIRTLFYVLKKHKWKILTLFLSTVITVTLGSLLISPIYRASSRLLIKAGREDVYVSPTGGQPTVIDYYSAGSDQRIQSEIAILESPDLVNDLINHFGVNRLFDFPDRTLKSRPFIKNWLFRETKKRKIPSYEKVCESVKETLEVSALPRSNVITITFDWPDPVIAAKVINKLVELYLDKHVKVHTDPQTYNLLKDQVTKWEEKLRMSEKNLEAFKLRHSITSLPQQKTILLTNLSQIQSQRKQTESDIQETEEMIASLEPEISKLDKDVQLQQTVDKRSTTLPALKARLVDLELQGLKEEIDRVKKMIAEEEREEERKEQVVVVSGKSPIRQSLEGDLIRAKTRLGALKAKEKNQELQVETYRQELSSLDRFEKQMAELNRQVTINEANYKLYLTKFEEAKILKSMDKQKIANVSVIEPAVPPLKPIKPKKRQNVLIGGFLGLFAGIGMAFLIEFINPVFRTRDDVDQFLGLPVLAILPKER